MEPKGGRFSLYDAEDDDEELPSPSSEEFLSSSKSMKGGPKLDGSFRPNAASAFVRAAAGLLPSASPANIGLSHALVRFRRARSAVRRAALAKSRD